MNTDLYTRLVIETVKESAYSLLDDPTQLSYIPDDMLNAGIGAFMLAYSVQGKSLYAARLAARGAMIDFVPDVDLEDSPLDDHDFDQDERPS